MTMLVSWIGVDQRGQSSLYLASDSRITWPGGGQWDAGRKLFAARSTPHAFGYCGDVLFPTQALGQVSDMIDHCLLFNRDSSPDRCFDSILDVLTDSLLAYPPSVAADFSILYATRSGEGIGCSFHLYQVDFHDHAAVGKKKLTMPSHSGLLAVLGTGKQAFQETFIRWNNSEVRGTSRAVFSAFADALHGNTDPKSGGCAQLIGLYRKGGTAVFGIIWEGRCYFYGTPVKSVHGKAVKWHNDLFEICDPQTLLRDRRSQPQPRPRNLQMVPE